MLRGSPRFQNLMRAAEVLVEQADQTATRARQEGKTEAWLLASDAVQLAANTVFGLTDARKQPAGVTMLTIEGAQTAIARAEELHTRAQRLLSV